jgi:hypothetical protein
LTPAESQGKQENLTSPERLNNDTLTEALSNVNTNPDVTNKGSTDDSLSKDNTTTNAKEYQTDENQPSEDQAQSFVNTNTHASDSNDAADKETDKNQPSSVEESQMTHERDSKGALAYIVRHILKLHDDLKVDANEMFNVKQDIIGLTYSTIIIIKDWFTEFFANVWHQIIQ